MDGMALRLGDKAGPHSSIYKNLTDLLLIKQENTVFTHYCWYKPLFYWEPLAI